MEANDFQTASRRTYPDTGNNLIHGVFGLTSEAGEVAGILQKVYQGHPLDCGHLVSECGDCLWMICEILDAIDFTLEECMQMNMDKLRKRYPDGFDPERSLHRAEGDI